MATMIDPKLDALLFKQEEPAPPLVSEYHREQLALHANHQRLKAERLAREAERDR
jgi:hypothetical protein